MKSKELSEEDCDLLNEMSNVDKARQTLKEAGYFVDNLWSIHDVMDKYECTEEEAQKILNHSLTNGATMGQIHFSIEEFADMFNLKEKEV